MEAQPLSLTQATLVSLAELLPKHDGDAQFVRITLLAIFAIIQKLTAPTIDTLAPPCDQLAAILQGTTEPFHPTAQQLIIPVLRNLITARHPASDLLITLLAPAVVLLLYRLGSQPQLSAPLLTLFTDTISLLLVIQNHASQPAPLLAVIIPSLVPVLGQPDPTVPHTALAVQVTIQLVQKYPTEAQQVLQTLSPAAKTTVETALTRAITQAQQANQVREQAAAAEARRAQEAQELAAAQAAELAIDFDAFDDDF
jgi:hypothetical protein